MQYGLRYAIRYAICNTMCNRQYGMQYAIRCAGYGTGHTCYQSQNWATKIQRNPNVTEYQGSGKMCSLWWGFDVSRFLSIHFAITGIKMVHYSTTLILACSHWSKSITWRDSVSPQRATISAYCPFFPFLPKISCWIIKSIDSSYLKP